MEADLIAKAQAKGISVLDLRAVSSDFYPMDHHPTATWHPAIAQAIAE